LCCVVLCCVVLCCVVLCCVVLCCVVLCCVVLCCVVLCCGSGRASNKYKWPNSYIFVCWSHGPPLQDLKHSRRVVRKLASSTWKNSRAPQMITATVWVQLNTKIRNNTNNNNRRRQMLPEEARLTGGSWSICWEPTVISYLSSSSIEL